MAADNVDVRFGKHDDYERLVLEWAKADVPDYKISKTKDGIDLKFTKSVTLNTKQIQGADSELIKEFQIKSPDQVFVFLNSYDILRDVQLGNKLVLDIYPSDQSAPQVETSAGDEQETVKTEPEPKKTQAPPPKKEEKKDVTSSEKTPKPVSIGLAPPPQTILGKAVKAAGDDNPHAFVLSSTDGVRMAAYERFGYLWIVINRVDLPIQPHIEGVNAAQFGDMKQYKVANNTATLWQIKIPDHVYLTGEGGSLYWRIIFGSLQRENKIAPATPQRKDIKTDAIRSGSIVYPAPSEKALISFKDPIAGDEIKAIAVDTSEIYTIQDYNFIDFTSLKSPVGFAFLIKNPDLSVDVKSTDVTLKSKDGLALTKATDISKNAAKQTSIIEAAPSENRLFNFNEWQMGPESALEENQRILLGALRGKNEAGQAERLLTMAKLNLAHGRGVEAKGFALTAQDFMPQLKRSASFLALRGVSSFLAGQYDLALPDLFVKDLEKYPEINLWKSAALAHLGDWQQAINTLPNDFSALFSYPDRISTPLILKLVEVALRNGDVDTGNRLLAILDEKKETLTNSQKNGVRYLKGEILRQNGEIEEAISVWTKLSQEEDPLYRTKSELSLVALGRNNNTIEKKDAVNRLENLRFVWRGDDLEIQVLRQLGLAEIEAEKYVDGFKTLRDTVVLSANNALNDNVTNLMMQTYENLFLTDKLETVSPLDAAMLYEEFRELTPPGDKGDRLVARLAERLVDADLLERAVKLLAYQLDYRLKGEDAVNTALRMAAIQIMDRRAEDALMTLGKADVLLSRADFPSKALKKTDLDLLKARALSETGDVTGALNLLENMVPPSRDIYRLEADLAWRAGRWNEAAAALRQLVLTSDYDSQKELSAEDAQLLLNYAITLNLSDQRATLINIRERHLDQMQMTDKGEQFEVITRPRQDALLADRNTLMKSVGETEIFSDFLDSYKAE